MATISFVLVKEPKTSQLSAHLPAYLFSKDYPKVSYVLVIFLTNSWKVYLSAALIPSVSGIQSVKFFGMVFTPEGMRPDPNKVAAVRNSKEPTNQEVLNSFVCMCAWNDKFLARFAEIV